MSKKTGILGRPPDLHIEALSTAQRAIYEQIANGPRGVVEGPLKVWLHSPKLAETAQALGVHCRYGSVLPPRLSEIAILVTGAFWRSGFEWSVHAPIAEEAGLTASQVEAIRTGKSPEFHDEEARLVYAISKAMHFDHRIPTKLYTTAVTKLGLVAVVDLIGILGYYTLISMTINAFDVPPPGDETDPFADLVPST